MAAAPPQPFTSSDASAAYVNATSIELLLIELVPMAYRISAEVLLRDTALADDLARQVSLAHGSAAASGPVPVLRDPTEPSLGLTAPPSLPRSSITSATGPRATTTKSTRLSDGTVLRGLRDPRGDFVGGGVAGIGGGLGGVGEDELREATFRRLEAMGHRVGQGIAERFSRDHHRLHETLDIIKFVCKDVWSIVFRKPIDNLKTNHRGVFVLTDKTFRPIRLVSLDCPPPSETPNSQSKDPKPSSHPDGPASSKPGHPSTPSFRFEEDTSSDTFPIPEHPDAGLSSVSLDGDTAIIPPITPAIPKPRSERQILAQIQSLLRFPAGVIRGALSAFGLPNVSVTAECVELPTVVFQVRVGAFPAPPGPTPAVGARSGSVVSGGDSRSLLRPS